MLMSDVWPEEPERLARLEAALAIARADPPRIERAEASRWLAAVLERRAPGTVVFQSVMWQYLAEGEQAAVTAAIARAGEHGALVWLALEPGADATRHFELSARAWAGGERRVLAR